MADSESTGTSGMQEADGSEAERHVTVANRTGLHLRPARRFVEVAARFASRVLVVCGDQSANGKSIMELLALAILPDSRIAIRAKGADAVAAVKTLADLVEKGFSEND